jgi:tetratricopeptide (TPR) repeat protein
MGGMGGMVGALALALAATAGAQVPSAPTAASTAAKKYTDCMALARSNPEKAIGIAATWERNSGEEGARHCSAVALLNTGAYAEAARRLESLAATSRRPGKKLKAELLAQAGQAWLIAGRTTEALSAQTRALALAGPRVELLLDRAITRASIGEYWEAIDDLNQAVDQDSKRVDALVFRATAWRKLKNLDLAQDDIARAVELAPGNVDALLERGNILSLRGDTVAAAANWGRVIALDAKSPAADAARDNLAKQDTPAKK